MKWFGENWGAPICESTSHTETPVGMECFGLCKKPIAQGDNGIITPYMAESGDPRTEAHFHLDCFLEVLFGRPQDHTGQFKKWDGPPQEPFIDEEFLASLPDAGFAVTEDALLLGDQSVPDPEEK